MNRLLRIIVVVVMSGILPLCAQEKINNDALENDIQAKERLQKEHQKKSKNELERQLYTQNEYNNQRIKRFERATLLAFKK